MYIPLLLLEQVHIDHGDLPLHELRNEHDPRRVIHSLHSHSGQDNRTGKEVMVIGGIKKGLSGGLIADVNEQQQTMLIEFPNPAIAPLHIPFKDLVLM
jgi:hypothetical protein